MLAIARKFGVICAVARSDETMPLSDMRKNRTFALALSAMCE